MSRVRVSVLCFALVTAAAPAPALAQGRTLAARVAALEATVDKLMGNVRPRDLVGTYTVYVLGVAMDPPGTQATHNQMASYVQTGTATLTPGLPRKGTMNLVTNGITVTEQAADANWTHEAVSDSGTGSFSWAYSNGVLTLTPDAGESFNELTLSAVAGGRAFVGAVGGEPGNNQQMILLVRQP